MTRISQILFSKEVEPQAGMMSGKSFPVTRLKIYLLIPMDSTIMSRAITGSRIFNKKFSPTKVWRRRFTTDKEVRRPPGISLRHPGGVNPEGPWNLSQFCTGIVDTWTPGSGTVHLSTGVNRMLVVIHG